MNLFNGHCNSIIHFVVRKAGSNFPFGAVQIAAKLQKRQSRNIIFIFGIIRKVNEFYTDWFTKVHFDVYVTILREITTSSRP